MWNVGGRKAGTKLKGRATTYNAQSSTIKSRHSDRAKRGSPDGAGCWMRNRET